MNQEARDKLVEAELQGVKQIRGQLGEQGKAQCAMGVLFYALVSRGYVFTRKSWVAEYGLDKHAPACPFMDTELENRECLTLLVNEAQLVVHLNDDHELSFLDIARKFPEPIDV